jgi:GNAT superfamily N-acetyltransferase
MTLRIAPVDDESLEQWRDVHNRIIAPAPLTAREVAERSQRYSLTLGYWDGVLVGNATVRPLEGGAVTVIVRILPEHRRRGFGSAYLLSLLHQVPSSVAAQITTVVLAANADGLAFALRHGFAETSRYRLNGVDFVELTRPSATA